MKKYFLFMCLLASFVCSNAYCQDEVHGIETKRVEYERYYNGKTLTCYGYEFHNANSIPVSVELELWYKATNQPNKLNDTKTIVLQSGESYIWKHEGKAGFTVGDYPTTIQDYYATYKAFKLQ